MSMSTFDFYFWASGTAGIAAMTALLFSYKSKKFNLIQSGIMLGVMTSGLSILVTMGVFSYRSHFNPHWILGAVFVAAFFCIATIYHVVDFYKTASKGEPSPLPSHGIFIPESSSWKQNGRNLVWLREPTYKKGTEKVYEIPRDVQILMGQTITIENGALRTI